MKASFFLYSFLAVLGLHFCAGLPLVAASGGHSSSRCAGLSLSRPLMLGSTGSRRAGSVVVAHGPSCSAACGILPDQGSNPCPLHWQADSQPLHHQGIPPPFCFSKIGMVFQEERTAWWRYEFIKSRMASYLLSPGLPFMGVYEPWKKKSTKGKFSKSLGCALDVDVLSCEALSQFPWLPGLREPPSRLLETVSAYAIMTQCPLSESIYLVFSHLDQGTHLLKDRAQVSYEPEKKKTEIDPNTDPYIKFYRI